MVLDPIFLWAGSSWIGREVLMLKDTRGWAAVSAAEAVIGVGDDPLAVEAVALEAVIVRARKSSREQKGR